MSKLLGSTSRIFVRCRSDHVLITEFRDTKPESQNSDSSYIYRCYLHQMCSHTFLVLSDFQEWKSRRTWQQHRIPALMVTRTQPRKLRSRNTSPLLGAAREGNPPTVSVQQPRTTQKQNIGALRVLKEVNGVHRHGRDHRNRERHRRQVPRRETK
jgi:hypothetical protein